MTDCFRIRIVGEVGETLDRWRNAVEAIPWPHAPASKPVWLAAGASEREDALLLVGADRAPALRRIAEGVPVVTIGTTGTSEHGLLALPIDATPREAVAALASLAIRSREVRTLHHDVAMATRIARGVETEFGRLDADMQMAALLQQEFLPKATAADDRIECAALWRPACGVSGDLYDLLRLDERHLGVFLADAVGHGLPAALQAMMLCRSLVTHGGAPGEGRLLAPSEALGRLNRDMADRHASIGRYATALYAVIDCHSGEVRVASAGSPCPLRVRADGTMETIDVRGPMLGMLPELAYDEVHFALRPGDRLLFHSDGFERAFRDEDSRDEHRPPRYVDVLRETIADAAPAAMIEALALRLEGESGSLHQEDDCTLIALRAKAA